MPYFGYATDYDHSLCLFSVSIKTTTFQAFFSHMSNYRKLCNSRQEVLFDLELEDLVEIEDINSSKVLTIPIKTTSGTQLAKFQWSIGFKPASDKVIGSYKVEFTPEGKQLCLMNKLILQKHFKTNLIRFAITYSYK